MARATAFPVGSRVRVSMPTNDDLQEFDGATGVVGAAYREINGWHMRRVEFDRPVMLGSMPCPSDVFEVGLLEAI